MRPVTLWLMGWVVLAGWCAAGWAAEPCVAVTADTEGCAFAAAGANPAGGLAQRAGVVAKLRAEPLVLIDAGNALFGADSVASGGKVIATAYKAMQYDAMNISFRDFRLGKDKTLELVREASLPAISANLLDEQTGKPLFPPYIVREAGGQKVAVVGVTEAPPESPALAHLKGQLAGVKVRPVLEALGQWVAEAKGKADRVVVVYYGTESGLRPVVEKFGGEAALIAVGGVRPEFLPESAGVAIVGSGEHGIDVFVARLAAAGQKGKVGYLDVDAKAPADPAVERALGAFVPKPIYMAAARPTTGPALALRPLAANRAVEVKITGMSAQDAVGAVKASAGHKLLVLSTVWENVIPLTFAENQALATQYQVPNLADHLYVVVNGRELACIHRQAGQIASHVPVKNFRIDKIGDQIKGDVVFEVPAEGVQGMELRFYDFAHGSVVMPLVGTEATSEVRGDKPVLPPQKNALLEAAVYAFAKTKQLERRDAPAGCTFAVVDFRARSLAVLEMDATAFDPKAKKGEETPVGTVADWKEARKYLQFVADGQYGYGAAEGSTLAEEPRFLPDLMTGGRVVFVVPEKSASLELRCDFPNAAVPGQKEIQHPAALTFALEGERPKLEDAKALVSVDDEVFQVAVVGQKAAGEFAGEGGGEQPVPGADVVVKNVGKGGEFFQTDKQLKHVAENGGQAPLDAVSYKGPYRPGAVVWIPAGERRAFQVVFKIPVKETRPRLAYGGVSRADILTLPVLTAEENAEQ